MRKTLLTLPLPLTLTSIHSAKYLPAYMGPEKVVYLLGGGRVVVVMVVVCVCVCVRVRTW